MTRAVVSGSGAMIGGAGAEGAGAGLCAHALAAARSIAIAVAIFRLILSFSPIKSGSSHIRGTRYEGHLNFYPAIVNRASFSRSRSPRVTPEQALRLFTWRSMRRGPASRTALRRAWDLFQPFRLRPSPAEQAYPSSQEHSCPRAELSFPAETESRDRSRSDNLGSRLQPDGRCHRAAWVALPLWLPRRFSRPPIHGLRRHSLRLT